MDNPTWGLYSFDLSAYPHLTRIEIYPDPNLSPSPVWNVLSFSVPPSLLALSVADNADPASTATASDAAIRSRMSRKIPPRGRPRKHNRHTRRIPKPREHPRHDYAGQRHRRPQRRPRRQRRQRGNARRRVAPCHRHSPRLCHRRVGRLGPDRPAGRKEIDVHVASLDVGTMGVVNGHNGSTSWLANNKKNSDGELVAAEHRE